jgi:hypothetical protein
VTLVPYGLTPTGETPALRVVAIVPPNADFERLPERELAVADLVLALSLEGLARLAGKYERVMCVEDLIPHRRVGEIYAAAFDFMDRFVEEACGGETLDGVDWPSTLRGDTLMYPFRDLMLGGEVGAILARAGVDRLWWVGAPPAYHQSLAWFRAALQCESRCIANSIVANGPRALIDRVVDAGWRRLRRLREAPLVPKEPRQVVAIFGTSEWRRFTTPLERLAAEYDFQLWYLGPIAPDLAEWAGRASIDVRTVPYPVSAAPDIREFFTRHFEAWCSIAAPRLAAAFGRACIDSAELQPWFERLFAYTLPRTVEWGRTLRGFLESARPEVLVGSAAYTYMTQFPYHVARETGIPSLALSHTFVPGSNCRVAAERLGVRNAFEREGYRESFPDDGSVVCCSGVANAASYDVAREAPPVGTSQPIVAVLTGSPAGSDMVLSEQDTRRMYESLRQVCQPPAALGGLRFVFKSHPRNDLTGLLRQWAAPEIEVLAATASIHELLERAWVVVIAEHYGGVVADAIAAGKPVIFLDASEYFFPKMPLSGHEAGEVVRDVQVLWRRLTEFMGSQADYNAAADRGRQYAERWLTPARQELCDVLLGRRAATL